MVLSCMNSGPQLGGIPQINTTFHKTSILHVSDLLSCMVGRTMRPASRAAIGSWGVFPLCFYSVLFSDCIL